MKGENMAKDMTKDRVKKVVLVLGASSEGGVGWVTAKRFAERGAKVVVSARRLDSLTRLAADIGGVALTCDVSDEAQVLALAKTLDKDFGHVHAVINAVGRVVTGTIETAEASHLLEAMSVEYIGNFFLFKHLAPVVVEGGAFVVISSLASTHYVSGVLPYANAKAAANNLVKYAAIELAPRRIRVNAILPGSIDTPMLDAIRHNKPVMDAIAREIPFGRPATANEIAAAAEWLCADDCFMTGTLIPVDGGNHLRRAPFPDEMPATSFDAAPD
jgi:NAD(P)-dependent dehydrogenase (short-subunit alcohol dehydrogenase family)